MPYDCSGCNSTHNQKRKVERCIKRCKREEEQKKKGIVTPYFFKCYNDACTLELKGWHKSQGGATKCGGPLKCRGCNGTHTVQRMLEKCEKRQFKKMMKEESKGKETPHVKNEDGLFQCHNSDCESGGSHKTASLATKCHGPLQCKGCNSTHDHHRQVVRCEQEQVKRRWAKKWEDNKNEPKAGRQVPELQVGKHLKAIRRDCHGLLEKSKTWEWALEAQMEAKDPIGSSYKDFALAIQRVSESLSSLKRESLSIGVKRVKKLHQMPKSKQEGGE